MNVVWSLDFMRDTLYGGRVFRTLIVINEGNRSAPGIDIVISIPAARLISYLEQLLDQHERLQAIRCDHCPDFNNEEFTNWCHSKDIELRVIQSGKPDQNAFIDRCSRTYREDVLHAYVFESLDQVSQITDEWIDQYNQINPHDSPRSPPPARFRECMLATEIPV